MKLLISTGAIIGIVAAVAVVLILIIWAIAAHNKVVALKVQCDDGFSTIDVYLKKRYDLIPNIVETVKGYAKHESTTLQNVIAARNKLSSATTADDIIEADNAMGQAIRGLNMLVERYPELKADRSFVSLQNQLQGIENELSQARKYYNATVREYNTKIQTFPTLIMAKFMKAKTRKMFTLDDNPVERQNVTVQF
ncbi:MAG: LemA family protein [Clostridia bacterium]|nr:LemA family protein [Clostridia bacterium]